MKNFLILNVKSVSLKNQLIDVILGDLFAGTDVKYTIVDRKIILAPDYLTNAQMHTIATTKSHG